MQLKHNGIANMLLCGIPGGCKGVAKYYNVVSRVLLGSCYGISGGC